MILNFDTSNVDNIKTATQLKERVRENMLELIAYEARDILLKKPDDDLAYLTLPENASFVLTAFQQTLDCRDIDSRMLSLFDCEKMEPYYKDSINHLLNESGPLSNSEKIKWKNVEDIENYYVSKFKKTMSNTRFEELEDTIQSMRYHSEKANIEMFSYFFININDAFIEKGVHKMALDFEGRKIICTDKEDHLMESPIETSFLDTLKYLDTISNGGLKLKYIQKDFIYSQFEAFCEINLRIRGDIKAVIQTNYERNVLFSQFPPSVEKSLQKRARI